MIQIVPQAFDLNEVQAWHLIQFVPQGNNMNAISGPVFCYNTDTFATFSFLL